MKPRGHQHRVYLSKETAFENTKKEIIRQCNWMMDTETEKDVWIYLEQIGNFICDLSIKGKLPIKKKTKTRHG